MSEMTVTVSGGAGPYKTAIGLALVRALRDHGISVGLVDEDPQSMELLGNFDKYLAEMKKKKTEILITTLSTSTSGPTDEMKFRGIDHRTTSHKAPNAQSVPRFHGKAGTGRKKSVMAPLGLYDKSFVDEILKAQARGLSIEEISAYMTMSLAEVEHVLDLYIPIAEAMGSIGYEQKEHEDDTKST